MTKGRNVQYVKLPAMHVYSQRGMRGAVFRDIEFPILRVPCITLV